MLLKSDMNSYVILILSLLSCWDIVFAHPTLSPEQYKETLSEPETCVTPSREKGWCLPINMCPQLFLVLVTKPISQSNLELLSKSKCGFLATVPKVCCNDPPYPNGGVPPYELMTSSPIIRTKPTKKQPKTTTRPSVSEVTTEMTKPQIFASDLNERVNEKPIINLLATRKECDVETTDKIFRGEVPDVVQYAFMALLEFRNDFGQRARCSGVLINNRHVLTSAHCVTGHGNWTVTQVRLGEYDTKTEQDCFEYSPGIKDCVESLTVGVEKVTVHEKYNVEDPNQHHDIALLKLDQEVKYTPFIRPICIATSQQEHKDMMKLTVPGERYKMIGWNRTAAHLVKRVKTVTVRENTECQGKYNMKLDQNQLCGQSERSNYRKDLKTPVLAVILHTGDAIGWYLGGLSTYPANPENGALRIYTKPANYVDWIIDKLQQSLH